MKRSRLNQRQRKEHGLIKKWKNFQNRKEAVLIENDLILMGLYKFFEKFKISSSKGSVKL